MFRLWTIIKSVILWSYERGTWQYDIMVVLILAFVFLTPNSWFEAGDRKECDPAAIYVNATEMARSETPQQTLEELIISHLRKVRGDQFKVRRVEPKVDSAKRVEGYCVWVGQ